MSKKTSLRKPIGPLRGGLPYWLIHGRLRVLHAIPYRALLFSEWFFGQTSGSSAGYRHRINMSLGLVTPPLDRVEEKRRSRAAPNNAGRALTEIHLPEHFHEITQCTQTRS
jgi:KDO2-lipid IV(A) lauroyltransferase